MEFEWEKIVEGWRNNLFPPEKLKEIIAETAKERLAICAKCPLQSDNAKVLGTYKGMRFDLHCTHCGCPLQAKVKSLSSNCPVGNWKAVATDEQRYEIEKRIQNETDELQAGDNQSSKGTS